jgi:misshapen/NIK-related kinase
MREEGREGSSEDKNNLAFAEKKKIEEMNNKLKLENRVKNAIFTRNNSNSPQNQKLLSENTPKRSDNDSRFSNFVRGFRRENTDFFPLSKRHSAILGGEQSSSAINNSPQKVQRSSAIFQRNRPKGEPVLTDFIPKRDNTLENKSKNANVAANANRNSEVKLRQHPITSNNIDLHRMRREKTESVIFVSSRNSNALNALQQTPQQVMELRNVGLINAS